MKLVIGNKNYSSWSLRPWLLMRVREIEFEEVLIPLYQPRSNAQQLGYSPAGKLPVLLDGDVAVWDSLAISEYLAERFPDKHLWPADLKLRAHARSIVAEMHTGFAALRTHMPMNLRASHPDKGRTSAVLIDIARVIAIWENCLSRYGGPFLFGDFSIADAFYAPIATRFQTYSVEVPTASVGYSDALLNLPAMQDWIAAGIAETGRIAICEIYD